VNQPSVSGDDPEVTFRRDVNLLVGEIWKLDAADDAMAAWYRVITRARRKAKKETERGRLPQ
jgi:hypothetical protein